MLEWLIIILKLWWMINIPFLGMPTFMLIYILVLAIFRVDLLEWLSEKWN